MKKQQKAKEAELERRFDAYMADRTKTDQAGVSKLRDRDSLIIEDLPAWAKGLAARDALEGATEGGQEKKGEELLRPSEQRKADAAAQPDRWGFGGN
jgi:hypothetical protein